MIVCARPDDTELDLATAPALARDLAGLNGTDHVLVDLTPVTFCDASAVNVLLDGKRRHDAAGGSLHLVGTSPSVRRVLLLGGLAGTLADERPPR